MELPVLRRVPKEASPFSRDGEVLIIFNASPDLRARCTEVPANRLRGRRGSTKIVL